jgi:hypothetical protein
MREVITIQIIRPNFEVLDAVGEKQLIEEMSKDIAEQILRQEKHRHKQENIAQWQKILLQWEIEDKVRTTYEKPKRSK